MDTTWTKKMAPYWPMKRKRRKKRLRTFCRVEREQRLTDGSHYPVIRVMAKVGESRLSLCMVLTMGKTGISYSGCIDRTPKSLMN